MTALVLQRLCRTAQGALARACLAMAIGVVAACEAKDTSPPPVAAQPVQQSAERGPVQLLVRVDRGEVSVGETLQLAIEVVADSGVAVEMPRFEHHIGDFEILDSQSPPDIPDGTKRRWTHQYSLRTLEAGDLQIPSVTVKFSDGRNAEVGGEPLESEISTQPLAVHVRSLLAGEFNPEQFRDIKDEVAVPLPWNYRPWIIVAVIVLIAASALAGLLIALRRRHGHDATPAPPPPPHLWALQQLDQLAAEHLIERGEHHEFFFRLSGIVRHYIERRFAIMAGEQTTDEFLREAQRNSALTDSHRALLRDFLRQADMVKFARFQPPHHESEAALNAARMFVRDTAPEANPSHTAPPAEANP